jgi:D-alanyl-D-alanine carboxypeptidase
VDWKVNEDRFKYVTAEQAVQVANRAHATQQGAMDAYMDEEDVTSEEGKAFDLFPYQQCMLHADLVE